MQQQALFLPAIPKALPAGLLAAALPLLARAQESAAPYPRTEAVPADTAYHQLPGKHGAGTRVEITHLDSTHTLERVYYPSGKLKGFHRFVTVTREGRRYSVSQGRGLEYYESGQLHVQTDQPTSQQPGERLVYYPSGQLRRRDQLPAQGPVTGECFGPDGQPVAYYPYQQMPVYLEGGEQGGQAAIVAAIQRRVRYPAEALRYRLAGQVLVRFKVDKTGRVADPAIVGGVYESKFAGGAREAVRQIEAAVLSAVTSLGAFRPGQRDGEAVAVSFTVPITFKIQ